MKQLICERKAMTMPFFLGFSFFILFVSFVRTLCSL